MLADDLGQRIAERAQEIFVRGQNLAVHVELDHGLRLADRLDLAGEIRVRQLLRADVGGELHHLERLAGVVEDRIVGGENPDFFPALAETLVLAGLEFAAAKLRPELAIGGTVALAGADEYSVMLALDLVEPVAQRGQEVLIGRDDGAVEIELDHRLGAADRGNLSGILEAANLACGDVGRELDDLHRLAGLVDDRIVGRLDPDLAAALAEPLVLGGLIFAATETCPELAIGRAAALFRHDEHAMVLAFDLVEPIADSVQEILVGREDGAVEIEFDDRLRLAECNDLSQSLPSRRTASPKRHK